MVNEKKIQEVRKKIRETIEEQPMEIENEPDHSGDPVNTIRKDIEEKDEENEKRDQQ